MDWFDQLGPALLFRRFWFKYLIFVPVSQWYVYPRTHIPSDMCIPGGDTINTDAHPRNNKEISSLAKGNVVDII